MFEQNLCGCLSYGLDVGWLYLLIILVWLVVFGGVVVIVWIGWQQMNVVFGFNLMLLQMVLQVFFVLIFIWVGFFFILMIVGFLVCMFKMLVGLNNVIIVVVMLVYNENSVEIVGFLVVLVCDFYCVGFGDRVEIFVLFDSCKFVLVFEEMLVISRFCDIFLVLVWYCRWYDNKGCKVGNVVDFVMCWGGCYDQMVVLDVDSIIGVMIIKMLLVWMNVDLVIGFLQIMLMLVGGQLIFVCLMQFVGCIYGLVIVWGVLVWLGDSGNFWGYNVLIWVLVFV